MDLSSHECIAAWCKWRGECTCTGAYMPASMLGAVNAERGRVFLTPVGLGLSQRIRKVSSARGRAPEPISQPDLST
ncbi:hypothetical protein PHYPO_G00145910 [Pangasianodon hypophthalmus]|uniref:Uncharacterized protein n=2 Tax=Pangasianodon TaxID=30992 RepID=A0A5N5K6B1_PANHP|nr:hypothetical protein PHYPO_G00145910 [Pangasianodon hypophthalmus]MCI4393107.1 hypothetical protein [Pangasianodon gigas]